MKSGARGVLARLFLIYDKAYQVVFRLRPINDFLFVNRAVYKGPERHFADGTVLYPGDAIGIIHFNNSFMSQLQERSGNSNSGKRAAFAFSATFVSSMRKLAQQLGASPGLMDLKVVSGVTWFKAHGRSIGFETEALPPGRRKRFLRAHFRVMLKVLFPHVAERENHRLEPHRFWTTRKQLQGLLAASGKTKTERLVKYATQE